MNKQRTILMLVLVATASLLFGCGREAPDDITLPGRWYSAAQVADGRGLYQTHCAVCHGESAAATEDWRTAGENGIYPPPLDGSAHAWHHPMSVLEQTIANGGLAFGGVMPGFRDTLDSSEARATIAFFQSFWSDDIYARWNEINNR